jgi:ribosomal-protein-serine acetyltransferase
MFPYRLDEHLSLELLELRHADELYGLTDANRDHLREWLPWVDSTRSLEDTKAFINAMQKQTAENNGFQTAILFKERIAGVVGHHRIDWASRNTSLGYWLAKEHEGQGIMTRSCRAYVSHAFQTLGLNRVEIRCAVANHKSCAIPERLGFSLEGTLRQAEWLYDHFVDHSVYGILAPEWKDD